MFGSDVLLLVWRRLSSSYLCYRDGSGIGLCSPEVKEATSLWENPYPSTVSWKSCAERQVNVISGLNFEFLNEILVIYNCNEYHMVSGRRLGTVVDNLVFKKILPNFEC